MCVLIDSNLKIKGGIVVFERILKRVVLLLFIATMASLTIGSMLYVAEMDFSTFDQKAVLVRTNPLVMLVGVAVFVLISVVIYWCMERVVNKKSAKWIITVIVIAVHVVLSVIWIMINPLQPDSDQGMVWKAAVELANEGKISNVWYFTRYPFQAGML